METEMEVDRLTKRQFDALPDYSCTIPTDTIIGQKWKRREPYQTGPGVKNVWYTGEYVLDSEPGMVGIKWRKVEVRTS